MTRSAPLVLAELAFADTGPRSVRHGDRYYGEVGARAQSVGLFQAGCGLPEAWRTLPCFTVLETGFGLGFNFLSTWQSWRADPARCTRLHYLAIERFPVPMLDLARAHQSEPSLAELARELRLSLPLPLAGCHRLHFDQGRVTLTLVYGADSQALAELSGPVDAIYLDGFAPSHNPELWSAAVMQEVGRLARGGARLASWCCTGEVRRQLVSAGFEVQRGEGFASKREITLARCIKDAPDDARCPSPRERSVIVVGAGVAGTALAERLLQREWSVTLLDAGPGPAAGASGNPSAVVRPLLSRDDNRNSQLIRAAFLYATQQWAGIGGTGRFAQWHPTGVLQLFSDESEAAQWQDVFTRLPMPPEFAMLLDSSRAARLRGTRSSQAGVLFPGAGWAEPAALCRRAVASLEGRASCLWSRTATSVSHDIDHARWTVWGSDGKPIARAGHLVHANGAGPAGAPTRAISDFLPNSFRPLQALRGEITQFAAGAVNAPELVVCADGYLSPSPHGSASVGATYDLHHDPGITAAAIADNLARAQAITRRALSQESVVGGRVGWRSVTSDRMPLVGADPDGNGCWHLRAFASRGVMWSPLMAEMLACEMHGEPIPVARSLRALLSPQRRNLRARIG